MNNDELSTRFAELLTEIAPDVDPDTLDPDADLRSEADLDSMDFLNLVQSVDNAFGIDIPESDYAEVRSLNGFLAYLAART